MEKPMASPSFQTTAKHIVDAVEYLDLDADTPVEITVRLSDAEKIEHLNALLKEGEEGEALPPEPLKQRLNRLHAQHPNKA
jgi:hypothetical protein